MQLQLPLSQSQPPSPCLRSTCPPILSSTCPPTPLLGPFTQSLLPTGPLDLSSHSGALHPSVQLLQQAQLSQHQLIKPMQPHEDSRTCSSYASSLFSSSHYPSPQLMPLAVSQPLLSTHQTPQHTPLLVPAWQEHADGSQEWSGHLAQQRPCALERAPSQEPGAAEFLAAISAAHTAHLRHTGTLSTFLMRHRRVHRPRTRRRLMALHCRPSQPCRRVAALRSCRLRYRRLCQQRSCLPRFEAWTTSSSN